MSNITNFNFRGADVRTMTSREIAELTNKEHKNVLADIRTMLEDLGLTSADFSADLPDAYGRPLRRQDRQRRQRPCLQFIALHGQGRGVGVRAVA